MNNVRLFLFRNKQLMSSPIIETIDIKRALEIFVSKVGPYTPLAELLSSINDGSSLTIHLYKQVNFNKLASFEIGYKCLYSPIRMYFLAFIEEHIMRCIETEFNTDLDIEKVYNIIPFTRKEFMNVYNDWYGKLCEPKCPRVMKAMNAYDKRNNYVMLDRYSYLFKTELNQ